MMRWLFLFVLAPMLLGLWGAAYAQEAGAPEAAYTTFNPNTGLGLATPEARYAITVERGCSLQPLVDVTYWPSQAGDGMGDLAFEGGACAIGHAERIADVPCFTDDAGLCKWEAEHNTPKDPDGGSDDAGGT